MKILLQVHRIGNLFSGN